MTPAQIILFVKIGVLSVFLVGVFISGHHIGAKGVQADWDASKAQMIDAQSKLIASHVVEIEELRKKQDLNNVQVSEDHQKALDELAKKHDADLARVRAAGGLRLPRSICSGPVITTPEAASNIGRDDNLTGTVALPEQITNDLFSFATDADRVTEIARSCQAWIRKNGFYPDHQNPSE